MERAAISTFDFREFDKSERYSVSIYPPEVKFFYNKEEAGRVMSSFTNVVIPSIIVIYRDSFDYKKLKVISEDHGNEYITYIKYGDILVYYIAFSLINVEKYVEKSSIFLVYRSFFISIKDSTIKLIDRNNFNETVINDNYDCTTIGDNDTTKNTILDLFKIIDELYIDKLHLKPIDVSEYF